MLSTPTGTTAAANQAPQIGTCLWGTPLNTAKASTLVLRARAVACVTINAPAVVVCLANVQRKQKWVTPVVIKRMVHATQANAGGTPVGTIAVVAVRMLLVTSGGSTSTAQDYLQGVLLKTGV